MIILLILEIVSLACLIVSLILFAIKKDLPELTMWSLVGSIIAGLPLLIIPPLNYFEIKGNEKVREQLVYQIDNLTPTTDKVALNAEIIEYNDWVIRTKFSKSLGVWSFYCFFELGENEIIQLV